MNKSIISTALVVAFITTPVLADSTLASQKTRASSHAPIGVMGDHLHDKGEFMLSYRFMRMDMDGSRIDSKRVSARETVGTMMNPGQFMVAPTAMPMDMHMLGVMAGVSDNLTLMAMVNFVSNSMDHLVRNGKTFTTESSGLGDSKIGAMIKLFDNDGHKAQLNLAVSLPTGSTDESDDTPAMDNAFLPYPMQLGSGTVDILPSITYSIHAEHLSWGAQVSARIRTGEADEGYTLGDRIALTSWIARDLSENLSFSLRLNYQDWNNIDGANAALNPNMIQTAATNLQAGSRTDVLAGLNYQFNNGHRLALEYGEAVNQNLDGPQMETDALWTFGWQKAF